MKRFIYLLMYLLGFTTPAIAQFTTVTNLSGTTTYGTVAVTVTAAGTASNITYCGTSPYWIGAGSSATPRPGSYTFSFSRPVTGIRVFVSAANTGESISTAINGTHYSLTAANVFSFTGSCGSSALLLSGDTLLCPTVAGSPGAAAGINIYECGGITQATIATNGLQNGSVFTFRFTDSMVCTATNNGPLCVGDTLMLSTPGTSSDTFDWSGPSGFTSTSQNPIRVGIGPADTGLYMVIKNGTDTSYTRFSLRPSPNITASSNSPVCIGAVISLFSGPDSVGQTYSWSGPGGFSSTDQNPTVLSDALVDSGLYTVIATWNGCRDTASVHVVVSPPVPVHLGVDVTMCAGNTLTMSSSDLYSSPTYLWSTGATSPSITVSATGTYWLQVTDGGCTGRDTVNLTVKRRPLLNLGIDTGFCSGSSLRLNPTAGAAETYLWSTGATTGSITVNTSGTYWVVADSVGCTSSDTIRVIEKAIPVVALGNDISVCSGVPVTLASSVTYPTATYQWITGSTSSSIAPVISGTYWLAVTVRSCTGYDTVNLEFRRHPVANLGRDSSFCEGESYLLTVPAGSDHYLWSTGDTTHSISVTATGTYWVYSDSIGCSSTDTIHLIEVPTFAVRLGPDTTYCTLQNVTLQSADIYTVSPIYNWSTGEVTPSIVVAATGTYWLQVDQLGCVQRDTIHIDIKYDSLTLTNRDTAICAGKSVQAIVFTNEIGGSYSYQWLPTTGIPFSSTINPLITPDTSATYTLIASTANCPPLSVSFNIDVQPQPIVYAGGNRQICQFDTLHLHAGVNPEWYGSYWYDWSPNLYIDNFSISDPVFTAGATQKYIVTVTTPAGCTGKDSLVINVNPGNFAAISTDQAICPNDSVQFTATGGATYRWYPAMYLSDSTSATPWVKAITNQHYTLVVTSAAGCADTLAVKITVFPAAIFSVPDSVVIFPGESYHFAPLTNCSSVTWFPGEGLNSPLVVDPTASPSTSTRYSIIGYTDNGCVVTDTVFVHVRPESLITLPNAFVPGDGPNGKFSIIKRGEATLNHFRIYNRWGNIMFETKDINEGWDGNYNGKPQPFGVYVYDVQAVTNTGTVFQKSGNVTLIR